MAALSIRAAFTFLGGVMAGPALPTNLTVDSTGHVSHTNAVHGIANALDTAIGTATSGQVLTYNGTVYVPATAGFASTAADASLATSLTGGSDASQSVSSGAFTQINLPTENVDAGGNFNNTASTVGSINAYCYRVPATGLYLMTAKVRPSDGTAQIQIGVGVHTANADHPSFQWNTNTTTAGGTRNTIGYTRLTQLTTGDQVRLYVFGSATFTVAGANLSIIRAA